MTDPRSQIPDVTVTADDGSEWLVRWRRLIIEAVRDGALTIKGEAELMPVSGEVEPGHKKTLPVHAPRIMQWMAIEDVPEDLAIGVLQFLYSQAQAYGQQLLDQVYNPSQPPDAGPDPEPMPEPKTITDPSQTEE